MKNMNLAQLESKLLSAGRSNPPRQQVPYAYEKRVMTHIRGTTAVDHWGIWSGALWRAAAPCVALTMFLSAWTYFSPGGWPQTAAQTADLSQALENAVLAEMEMDSPGESLW